MSRTTPHEITCTDTVIGVVKRIRFAAPDGGFQILQIAQPDGTETTLVGPLRGASVGSTVEAEGRWEDSRFGRQFRVGRTRWAPPTTVDGLVAALQGLVEGIGEGYARRIVEGLGGPDGARLWLDGLGGLPQIPRVRAADLQALRTAWGDQKADRELEAQLASLGVQPAARTKIAERYGARALSIVKDRPYDLALEIDGIGFQTADAIARAVGIAPDGVERAVAALRHALFDEAHQRGHVWAERREAVHLVERLCGPAFADATIDAAIDALRRRGTLDQSPAGNLSLKTYADAEAAIAARAIAGCRPTEFLGTPAPEPRVAVDPRLTDEQRAAVTAALGRHFTVMTGGPGVGKTTTTKAIADAWMDGGVTHALCAPTGRAAKRLQEATGAGASTIHRLLGYDPIKKGFLHDARDPLPIDAVLVDESSMVSIDLMHALFAALRPDARVVLVGDADQLPPVGPGAPFRDLVEGLPAAAVHRLTQVFRQAQGSRIVMGSREILGGRPPAPSAHGSTDDGALFRIVQPDLDACADLIVRLVPDIAARFGVAPADVQVLAPQRKGTLGVELLNLALRDRLNPRPPVKTLEIGKGLSARSFRLGDRVLQTKNDYTRGVVNGDLGVIETIETQGRHKHLSVRFEGVEEPVRYSAGETADLELAYAFTIHKCVHPDTLVETPDGLMPIRDLPPSGTIATPTGRRRYDTRVAYTSKPLLEITSVDGYTLTVTPEHGMDVWTPQGFVRTRADQLTEGSILRLKLGATCEPCESPTLPKRPASNVRAKKYRFPSRLTPAVAEFLGLMVADGTVFRGGFRLVKRHRDVAKRFRDLCATIFRATPHPTTYRNCWGYEIDSTEIVAWLRSVGGLEPNAKAVPDCVLRAPLRLQSAFLRGLFEDGTVNVKSRRLDHIEFSTIFPALENAVRTMLLRFGIITGTTPGQRGRVYIYGQNAVRFRRRIGFVARVKNDRLALPAGSERYSIPLTDGEVEIVRSLRQCKCLSEADANNLRQSTIITRHVALKALKKLRRVAPFHPAGPILIEKLAFHHSRIRSIRRTRGPAMCVRVPHGHRFLQNGFAGWNSQGGQFPVAIVVLHEAHGIMLERSLVYTAVTRAQRACAIVGTDGALVRACKTARTDARRTTLPRALLQAQEDV